ncbi:MAG TPA: methyltransferase, FxLD system [Chloroflexota bacterium]|nr:methyltransferase, FxLD system [Chloroflexota bacterium]
MAAAHTDDLRGKLVDQLVAEGSVRSAAVEAAFRAVPRHLFVPGVDPAEAYADRSIQTKRAPDGGGISSSSQPTIMAIMLEQLALEPGMRLLEVGAGTGYNAALLAHLVGARGRVTTVDIDEDIVEGARRNLAAAGLEGVRVVRVVRGDGALGWPQDAPYDRIVLTVASWDLFPAWPAQLAPGGRLLLPLTLRVCQASAAFERVGDHLASVSLRGCGFMALRGPSAGPRGYVALGDEPGLSLAREHAESLDGSALHALLTGPADERPTGLELRPREIAEGLNPWIALHDRRYAVLSAEGAWRERGLVFGPWGGGSANTLGLADTDGLALLVRPPDAFAADEPWTTAPPFGLRVRSHGDGALADRLVEVVRAWDAAGRPTLASLRLRAYPREVAHTPRPGEIVLEKRHARLVCDWRPEGG